MASPRLPQNRVDKFEMRLGSMVHMLNVLLLLLIRANIELMRVFSGMCCMARVGLARTCSFQSCPLFQKIEDNHFDAGAIRKFPFKSEGLYILDLIFWLLFDNTMVT